MISYRVGDTRFNYRVAGVCIHDGHVLIHCFDGNEAFWALPGGRVELLEPSTVALLREMREELGVEVALERLLWVVENFFVWDGFAWEESTRFHELGFYYRFTLPIGSPLLDTTATFDRYDGATRLTFRWLPLDALDGFPLMPAFLRTRLRSLPPGIEHILHVSEGVDEG